MRVIAGSAKRIQLKTPEGLQTRPTTDRIKETLFNMIAPYLYDCTCLDLFSGSGGIGIEALSRGAREAVFVDSSPEAAACIRENLQATGLSGKAMTLTKDVMNALYQLEGEWVFDYVFLDPPYHQELEKEVLTYLSGSDLIHEDTVIIVETAKDTAFPYLDLLGYMLLREKGYKTNKHIFLAKKSEGKVC